ncbi:hypothetical protein V8U11_06250 [Pseudomonas chlororaphis]|uniref:hypothetical protein n=1 Tax=Pseudomonas chlororaphis TaxID=587753 RepID=UPI0030CE6177
MLHITSDNSRVNLHNQANSANSPSTKTQQLANSILNTLNIPLETSLEQFCTDKFKNIFSKSQDQCLAAQTMAIHLNTLLAEAGEVNPGPSAKFELISNLTNSLLRSLTDTDLLDAQKAAKQINAHFNQDIDSQGNTQLDDILNMLDLSYHKATHISGRMGHAQEMQSDIKYFYDQHPLQDLAGMLAYFHDHVQIMNNVMGVGNSQHWGLNEIATAAALATIAKEAGVDEAGQNALLKVGGAVIPVGTAFNFIPDADGKGNAGLGTLIECMLRRGESKATTSEVGRELTAMAFALSICDTQRNNLAGLARPTDSTVHKHAPHVYRLLVECAEDDPKAFGATYFDNGKLSEAGLALCSKLTATINVFQEFTPTTYSTPIIEAGKPNNPLSKIFDPGSLTPKETVHATLQLLRKNGAFGSTDVPKLIESFSSIFSHPVLDKMKEHPILDDPQKKFTEAYERFTDKLAHQLYKGRIRIAEIIHEMSAMGGADRG